MCYCCGFDFGQFYGSKAKRLAIVHHLQLFGKTNGKPRRATVNDVRVVCANCHYVIHMEKSPIDVDELKRRISEEGWSRWSSEGVSRPRASRR
jgi:predicted HNH restriction endonuclease